MKHLLPFRKWLLFFLLFASLRSVAQNTETIRAQASSKLSADSRIQAFTLNASLGTPSLINLKAAASVPVEQSESLVKDLFDLDAANFELREVSVDNPYPGI